MPCMLMSLTLEYERGFSKLYPDRICKSMGDEAQELRESAEKAREDRSLAAVSLTMAALAVFVAVVSLLGHRAHTEEVVLQAKSSDQWSYYQAKNIRQHEDELFADLTATEPTLTPGPRRNSVKNPLRTQSVTNMKRQIFRMRRANWRTRSPWKKNAPIAMIGGGILEIGLGINRIPSLGQRMFWAFGIGLSIVGVVVAVTGN